MKKQNLLENFLCSILSFLFCFSLTFGLGAGKYIILIVPFLLIFSFIIIKWIFKLLDKVKLDGDKNKIQKKEYIIYALIIIAGLAFAFFAYFPASTTTDSIDQFEQALQNNYSDWHPLFHTLIFLKLPMLISESLQACALFQCIFIFAIMMYFCVFSRKYFFNHKKTTIMLLFIVLNPIFLAMSATILKDIPFSFCLLLGTMFLIEIVITQGKWIYSHKNKILFIAACFGIVYFRHNGIASFLLMMLLLIIFYKKERKFYVTFTVVFLIAKMIICGPIYNHFNIQGNGGAKEMMGVPMNQMSYIYNKQGDVTEEELAVLNNISPLKTWTTRFNQKNFNAIKWREEYNIAYVEENILLILKTWKNMVIRNPIKAVKSYIYVTSPIWEIKEKINFIDTSDIKTSNPVRKTVADYNRLMQNSIFRTLVIDVGEALFLILFSLAIVIKKNKFDLKKYIPFALVLSNVFIIMLLITGEEVRFVYSSILCMYPLLMFALKKEKSTKSNSFNLNNTIKEFLKYFVVGVIAAVVNIGMLYVFTDIFHLFYIISNILSFLLGLVTNYVLCKKYVFKTEQIKNKRLEFIIYATIGAIGLLIDTLLIWCFVENIGLHYMISKIVSTFIVFIWNFGARKVFYKVLGGKL